MGVEGGRRSYRVRQGCLGCCSQGLQGAMERVKGLELLRGCLVGKVGWGGDFAYLFSLF